MKKSKKLLSILLSVVMVFSIVAMPVSAAVPANVTTLEDLVKAQNLAGLIDWLLTSLNDRKEEYADSVLNFVCAFVEDVKTEVPENVDVFNGNVATSTKATYVMNFLDKMLAEQNLNSALGDDILNIVNAIPGLSVDLNSINGVLATLKSVNDIKGIAGGDIANLNLNAMVDRSGLLDSAQSRSKTGDLQIIFNLLQFLKDNTNIFRKFLTGSLDLGIIGTVAGDLANKVNGYAGQITTMLKDLVYEKLLGAPDGAASHAASKYADWSVDQMAIAGLVKMLTGSVPENLEKINDVLDSTCYNLLTSYGDELYNRLLLGWLQNDFIGVLDDFTKDNPELRKYFKFDFTFSASEFNFADAENGVLGEFNNVVVALLNKLLAADVLAELKLEEGGNDKLNANLEKVVKFILPKMAEVIDPYEFDFTKYTEEYVADKELSELAVEILKIFFPGWFHLEADDMAVVNQMDTMAEAATLAVYYALITFNDVMFAEGNYDYISEWNAAIFEADGVTLKDLGNSAWGDICITMAADAAMFGFALNGDKFFFDFDMEDIKAAKAAGWNGEAFLDEIADWAIDMVKGLPAVTDHLNGQRGVPNDNYGPFYKLNVLLNEILNWSFLNNVSYGSFNLDIETLIFDGLLENVYEFDIAGILGLFAVNNKADNLLNMNTVPALLSVVDNVLNILFTHTQVTQNVTVPATCAEVGFSVTACAKCGLYTGNYVETAKTAHNLETEILKAATCVENGLVRYTCTDCDHVLREATAASGHKFNLTSVEIDGIWYYGNICTVCEESDGELQLAPTPDSIEIATAPAKVEYTLNSEEELDLAGLVVKEVYTGGYKRELSASGYELLIVESGLDLTVAGEQEIVISYLGREASFTVTVVDPNAGPEYILGDATGDGEISSGDARAALRHSVGLELLDGARLLAADYNGDGEITSGDARSILRLSVGLDPNT